MIRQAKINKGFTLLEVLLVIAMIGLLAAIVLIALNPNRQIALAQNARRTNDVGAIYKAIQQYNIENQKYPSAIEAMDTGYAKRIEICKAGQSVGCLNITTDLVPIFLANNPSDPSRSTAISTKYSVIKNINNTIAVRAEGAELGKEIIAGVILDRVDLSAPSAITDLNATVIGGNSVNLTWTAPSSPLPIQEYIILYSSGQDFSSQTVISGVASTATTYLVENLTVGIYKFKVIAVNTQSQGPDSNIAQAILCGSGTCEDHNGNDWIISTNQPISGLHYNVRTFRVDAGITAGCVLGVSLAVYANEYQGLGNIDATGCGYRGGKDGHTGANGLGAGGGREYSGGGYGGAGGGYYSGNGGIYGGNGGVSYGNATNPVDLGSGGGCGSSSCGSSGGRGGGAIKIVTSGNMDISGTVTANGASINNMFSYVGAGAGGSIWLSAGGQMTGTGVIRSDGGNSWGGGPGGGGRIALYYGSSAFTGTVTANGGTGDSNGGAGTVYTGPTNTLVVSAGVTSPAVTDINPSMGGMSNITNIVVSGNAFARIAGSIADMGTVSNMTVTGNAIVEVNNTGGNISRLPVATVVNGGGILDLIGINVSSNNPITVSGGTLRVDQGVKLPNTNLTIGSGGILTHQSNPIGNTLTYSIDLTLASLTVNSGGSVDVAGKGYRAGCDGHSGNNGFGPGGGERYSGGGYGGAGGGIYGGNGGVSYGNATNPVDLGSGGGCGNASFSENGGRGGGAIKIVTSGNMDISGTVTANGAVRGSSQTMGYNMVGGGAGGSIWLSAGGQMTGAGVIRSDGGSPSAGGGAGGRIALYYGSGTFTGTVTANGGISSTNGGAGTIYRQ